jgi:hypothetical protein
VVCFYGMFFFPSNIVNLRNVCLAMTDRTKLWT